jgi:hypothetical protein
MGKKIEAIDLVGPLRIYRTPWRGELVLACRKCQKKMKKRGGGGRLGKIRRWFKARTKRDGRAPAIHVLDVPCVKLCPKGGVTIFSQRQLAHHPPGVCIARTEEDLEAFYRELRAGARPEFDSKANADPFAALRAGSSTAPISRAARDRLRSG